MTDTPDEKLFPDAAFTTMAQKIKMNAAQGFAGAFVIYPPGAEPVSMLFLDEKADAGLFWSSLKSRVEMAIAELDDVERRNQSGFGRR